jgi:hypothetical protein
MYNAIMAAQQGPGRMMETVAAILALGIGLGVGFALMFLVMGIIEIVISNHR